MPTTISTELVRAATQEYQHDSDPLANFVMEMCVTLPECSVRSAALYKAYKRWADELGLPSREVITLTRFGRLMADRYHKERESAGVVYHGLGLRSETG